MTTSGDSWRELNAALKKATEATCLQMLNDELMGHGRLRWLMRIRGRYCVLRNEREVKELESKWSARHGKKAA